MPVPGTPNSTCCNNQDFRVHTCSATRAVQVCKLLRVMPVLRPPEDAEDTPRNTPRGAAQSAAPTASTKACRQRTLERVGMVQHFFTRIVDAKRFGSVLRTLEPHEQVCRQVSALTPCATA